METQLFTTNEAIIKEYKRLRNELDTKECYDALETFADKICSEKKDLWKTILNPHYALERSGNFSG